MELQGALVASRLGASIQRETNYKIRSVTWWTDSEIVLKWINTRTKRLKSYEAHRVQEIEDLTDTTRWRWVPSELNPADYATKSTKFESTMNETWLLGPSFLKQPEDYWPQNKFSSEVPDNAEIVILLKESLTPLPDPHRFSKWLKLIRSTAWILRFCKNIKKSEHQDGQQQRDFFKKVKLSKGKIPEDMENFELEVSELENAEKFWWRKIQAQHFEEEIHLLRKQEYPNKSSKLYELSPFMDDCGILRMNSRIQYADVAFDIKFPIILPSAKDEIAVKMLIQHHHEELKHTGRETVINNLRMRFWIINMRQSVKSITRQCQFCKIKNAKALQPEMSPLPPSRLKPYTRPFSYCGVDYFGPLLVKVKRSTEKRYGVLFTCFNTRAIHIELAVSLNTDSALMAIHRMMGRRGQPVELWSDNGTNFVGAENEMKNNLTEMDQGRIIRDLSKFKIKWIFNTPAAPFMGGVWERLIKSVKKVLYITLKEQRPTEELLLTLLVEAESIVNCRPISYVSCDKNELEALTPMHFLIGSGNTVNIPGVFTAGDTYGRRQWRIAQVMAERFWLRWSKEYIPLLRKRSEWFEKENSLKIDDVVALVDGRYRNSWILGRVLQLYPGRDKQIRSVQIKTKDGTLVRPVNVLIKLEVGGC